MLSTNIYKLTPLSNGDTISIVSPATVLPERFSKQEDYSIKYLENLGYRVRNDINRETINDPTQRAAALMSAYTSPDVKAIFPICGGPQVYEILGLLDYKTIAQNPKIICGYSFIASLLLAITAKSSTVTFVGPHINFINDRSTNRELSYTTASFWNMLTASYKNTCGLSSYEMACLPDLRQTQNLEIRNIYKNPDKIKVARRDVQYIALNDIDTDPAPIYIQSIDSMLELFKCNININLSNKLLVLDTIGDSFDTVHKKIELLNSYSCLSRTEGIIFSSFNERSDVAIQLPELKSPNKILGFLKEISQSYKIDKLYYGFPTGHCKYKLTLPIGLPAQFKASKGTLSYMTSPFCQQR